MAATALIHREAILLSIAAGKRLSDLSASLKVSPQAISKVLHADPEYQAAIEIGHALRLDNAERAIENAAEQVDVARAGAVWRAVSWRASVEVPHRWGAKQLLMHEHRVDVSDRLQADLSAILGRVVSTQRNVVHEGESARTDVMSNTHALPDSNNAAPSDPAMLDQVDDLDPLDPAT